MFEQIIPCNTKMDAVFRQEDGSEKRVPIIMFELWFNTPDEDVDQANAIWPVAFDPDVGVNEAPHLSESNFVRYEIEGR